MMGRMHPGRTLRSLWAESPSHPKRGLGGVGLQARMSSRPLGLPRTEPSRISGPETQAQVVQV